VQRKFSRKEDEERRRRWKEREETKEEQGKQGEEKRERERKKKETINLWLDLRKKEEEKLKINQQKTKPTPRKQAMKIDVVVQEARGLIAADRGGTSDPYFKLSIAGTTAKTKTQKKTLTPKYNEKFSFDVKPPKTDLVLDVYDWDAIGKDEKIGEGVVDLSKANKKETSGWFPLTLKKKPAGEVFLIFSSPDVAAPPIDAAALPVNQAALPAEAPVDLLVPIPVAASGPTHPSFALFAPLKSVSVVQAEESGSFIGLEGANTYNVYDTNNKKKEKLLIAKEISSNLARAGVTVVDEKGKASMSRKGQISVEFRPAAALKTSLWTFRGFTQPDMIGNLNWQLELPPAQMPPEGVEHVPDLQGAATFNEDECTVKIMDYRTNAEVLSCAFKKGAKVYQFMTPKGAEGAVVTRQSKSMFADGDTFKLDFSEFLSPSDKALLTLSVIALDFMYFESVPVTIHGTLAEGRSASKANLTDSLGKAATIGTPPLSRK